jgi:predicted RNA-binding protein with PUA-like domain
VRQSDNGTTAASKKRRRFVAYTVMTAATKVLRAPILIALLQLSSVRRVCSFGWKPQHQTLLCRKVVGVALRRYRMSASSQPPPPMSTTNPNYFLLKEEPDEFSIQDLHASPNMQELWSGIRNYQARNTLRGMKVGDMALYYHSSCKVPAVVGKVQIIREPESDKTALDPNHKGYDPKSTKDCCRWDAVLVQLNEIHSVPVTLKELKAVAKVNNVIAGMTLFKNTRLSVQALSEDEWNAVEDLVQRKEVGEDLLACSIK